MRLSTFIRANIEPLLREWEDFARSLGTVTAAMSAAALRDHGEQILLTVAIDLETAQTPAEQEQKSKGRAPARPLYLPPSAATSHGSLRADDGFSLEQMISEYRALRASVLRLWSKTGRGCDAECFEDITRFNEAIDEAVADSIQTYSFAVEQMFAAKARRRMEAMGTLAAGLGHDMANVLLPMRACLDTLVSEGLTPATAPHMEAVRRAVGHLEGLSKGLRSLAMDPDDPPAAADATSLHEWWGSAISPFTWALPKGVRLHVSDLDRADSGLPPVRVPAHVLMQAVFNLVQNSAQALAHHDPDSSALRAAGPGGTSGSAPGPCRPARTRRRRFG